MRKAQVFVQKPPELKFLTASSNVLKIEDEHYVYDDVLNSTEEMESNILTKCVSSFTSGENVTVISVTTKDNSYAYTEIICNCLLNDVSTAEINFNDNNPISFANVERLKRALRPNMEMVLYGVNEINHDTLVQLDGTADADIFDCFNRTVMLRQLTTDETDIHNLCMHAGHRNSELIVTFRRLKKDVNSFVQDSTFYYVHLNRRPTGSPIVRNTLHVIRNFIDCDILEIQSTSTDKGKLLNAIYNNTSATYIVLKLDAKLTLPETKRILYFTCSDYHIISDHRNDTHPITPESLAIESLQRKIEMFTEKLCKERKQHAQSRDILEAVVRREIVNEFVAAQNESVAVNAKLCQETVKATIDNYIVKRTNDKNNVDINNDDMGLLVKQMQDLITTTLIRDRIKTFDSIDKNSKAAATQTDVNKCDLSYEVDEYVEQLEHFNAMYKTERKALHEQRNACIAHTEKNCLLNKLLDAEKSSKSVVASKVVVLEEQLMKNRSELLEKIRELTEQRCHHKNEIGEINEKLRFYQEKYFKQQEEGVEIARRHEDEIRSIRNFFCSPYSPKLAHTPSLLLQQKATKDVKAQEKPTTVDATRDVHDVTDANDISNVRETASTSAKKVKKNIKKTPTRQCIPRSCKLTPT